ncbi:MAG: hypothetical protein ACREUQ_12340 [Burkholderiales bacterium]
MSFALACAERLQPRREFSGDSSAVALVRSMLDTVFDVIGGNSAKLVELHPLAAALEAAPYLDDDAAAATAYAVRCLLSGDAQNALRAAQRGYDARDRQAQEQNRDYENAPDYEERLLAHPAGQQELAMQIADLDALAKSADAAAMVVLRARKIVQRGLAGGAIG